ncbi:MAG: hypothetical protein EOO24_15930 [Comamonadaceae bacterium]|nr:MAG: hypothetical protein EOO24_15930 [Comamonadaceae bacterium]
MTSIRRRAPALAAALLAVGGAIAQPAAPAPAPAFDVAYRAWEIVTGLARENRAPALAGDCAKTFRPFVIPGLKRQTRQEEDVAAGACVAAARSACANGSLRRSADIAKLCEEFR